MKLLRILMITDTHRHKLKNIPHFYLHILPSQISIIHFIVSSKLNFLLLVLSSHHYSFSSFKNQSIVLFFGLFFFKLNISY